MLIPKLGCFLSVIAAVSLAQHETHMPAPSAAPFPQRIIIDGAKNPELISDAEAIHVFLLSVAEPQGATARQRERQAVRLARSGINKETLISFTAALDEYSVKLQPLLSRAESLSLRSFQGVDDSGQQRALVARQMQQLSVDHFQSFLRTIHPQEAAKLNAHITYVKTKMKIIPPPNMGTFAPKGR